MPCNSITNIHIQHTPVLKFHHGLHTTICVLILLYMRARTTVYVFSYWRESVCVCILLPSLKVVVVLQILAVLSWLSVIKREHAFTLSFSLIKMAFFMKKGYFGTLSSNSTMAFILVYMCPHTTIYACSHYYACVVMLLCVLILLCVRSHTRIYVCLVFLPSCCMCAFSYSYICLSRFLAFVLHAGQGVGKRATKVRVTTRTSRFTRWYCGMNTVRATRARWPASVPF